MEQIFEMHFFFLRFVYLSLTLSEFHTTHRHLSVGENKLNTTTLQQNHK